MDNSHFSSMINDFKQGIFGALNERKEELIREGRKVRGHTGLQARAACDESDAGSVRETGKL